MHAGIRGRRGRRAHVTCDRADGDHDGVCVFEVRVAGSSGATVVGMHHRLADAPWLNRFGGGISDFRQIDRALDGRHEPLRRVRSRHP